MGENTVLGPSNFRKFIAVPNWCKDPCKEKSFVKRAMMACRQVSRCVLPSSISRIRHHVAGSAGKRLAKKTRNHTNFTHATRGDESHAASDLVTVWGGAEIPKPFLTTYIPVVLVILILMYLDAAYSGDWSRVGVLTGDQEQFLRDFCVFGVSIHALLGVAAAKISKDRGERTWLIRGLKTFIVGIVSFTEVVHLPEEA